MPKVKEPRIPLKGEKPSNAPKLSETKRKAPPRSEEIVVESDSEGSTSESSAGHSSGSESDPERRKNTKKPKESKVAETEPSNPPVPDDSSEEEESSEESDSESEDGLPDPDRIPKINGKVKKAAKSKDVEMADASEEGSGESEEADQAQPVKKASTKSHSTKSTPAAAYEPPPGYSLVDMKSNDGASIRFIIPDSDTTKQVWHITAPAGIPLADVKSFALAKIDSKQPVFSHKGSDFSLVEDKSASAEAGSHKHVLIPAGSGKGYAPIKAPVSRTLHVQQIITLPNLSKKQANPVTGSNAAGDANRPPVRGPKPQPKGLRMRYKPPGFGSGRPGAIGSDDSEDNDVEMADAGPAPRTFQMPKSVSQPPKRKEADSPEVSSKTPKADKKRRKEKEHEAEKAETEAIKAKEVVVEQSRALTEGTRAEFPQADAEKERLRAEKEQRREERRLKREKKEERRKARESAATATA
ncbi:hypothetical protein MBLNU457_1487t1 [Dothideomycetes sp. NU457]